MNRRSRFSLLGSRFVFTLVQLAPLVPQRASPNGEPRTRNLNSRTEREHEPRSENREIRTTGGLA